MEVEEYLKQRLLINSNGDVFTKFDELVSVVFGLVLKKQQDSYNEGYSSGYIDRFKVMDYEGI